MKCARIVLIAALILPVLSACKSAQVWDHTSEAILPVYMMVRRPVGYPANPKAGPGGTDYKAQTLPQSNTDMQCKPPLSLFDGLDKMGIEQCLISINQDPPKEPVTYRLILKDQPVLSLQFVEDKTPPCLKETLAEIPVPREVFYEAYAPDLRRNPEEPSCFATALDIYADEKMGVKLPLSKSELVIKFPLMGARPSPKPSVSPSSEPETSASITPDDSPDSTPSPKPITKQNLEELDAQLLSWALAPFFHEDKKGFIGRVVPEVICDRCLGEKRKDHRLGPAPETWPKAIPRPAPKIEDYERLKKEAAKKKTH